MILINIELKDQSKLKELIHKLHNKIEDIGFLFVTKIPEKCITHGIMNWLERYTEKRMNELQCKIIHQKWYTITLENVVNDIHIRQQN